jgi:hypothetical protein
MLVGRVIKKLALLCVNRVGQRQNICCIVSLPVDCVLVISVEIYVQNLTHSEFLWSLQWHVAGSDCHSALHENNVATLAWKKDDLCRILTAR